MISFRLKSHSLLLAALISVIWIAQCSSGQTTEEQPQPTERGSQESLTGCVEGDCVNGNGTYVYDTGDTYKGPFKNGLREGSGTMRYANGDIYNGSYVSDKRVGEGTYTFANGDEYKGEFRDGLRGGQGTYTWTEDSAMFKGEFAEDGQQGKGIMKVGENTAECVLEQRKVICENGTTRKVEGEGK